MASSAGRVGKLEEAQASARSCVTRPDFLPCDGGRSACMTHSHGQCFKLHWCCHLDWCHCRYVYQPMTSVCLLPSSSVPSCPSDYTSSYNLSILLYDRFLRAAPYLIAPLKKPLQTLCSPFLDGDGGGGGDGDGGDDGEGGGDGDGAAGAMRRTDPQRHLLSSPSKSNQGKPLLVSEHLRPHQTEQQHLDRQTVGQQTILLASSSSPKDSGIHIFTRSHDKEEEEEELGSHYHEEAFSLLMPSRSLMEVIEQTKTSV